MQLHARLLAAIVVALVSASCRSPLTLLNPSDPAIYAVILDSLFAPTPGAPRLAIVLDDSTRRYPEKSMGAEFWSMFDSLATPDPSVARDFQSAVQTRHPLRRVESQLRNATRVQFAFANALAYAELRHAADSSIRSKPGVPGGVAIAYWQEFRKRYPTARGTVTVSAIGYAQNGSVAMVYVQRGCSALCGESRIVMLHRDANVWRIVRIQVTSVS